MFSTLNPGFPSTLLLEYDVFANAGDISSDARYDDKAALRNVYGQFQETYL